jgi:hypothetical protein
MLMTAPQGTPPVGPQYGLEPRLDHTLKTPPAQSEDILSTYTYNDPIASEFGGVPGLISPPPHVPTASERLSMIYHIDPTDDGTLPESVPVPELDGAFDPR